MPVAQETSVALSEYEVSEWIFLHDNSVDNMEGYHKENWLNWEMLQNLWKNDNDLLNIRKVIVTVQQQFWLTSSRKHIGLSTDGI